MQFNDDVTLVVGGISWSGWERIRITRGIERMPSDFSVVVTERYPNSSTTIDIKPGDPIIVKIGADAVITGYVDNYMPTLDAGEHLVEISGRGKCQDLVDCAAEFSGQQINQTTALGVAETVCKPFGIQVSSLDGPGQDIYQFNSVLTETAYSVIERVTRYSGLLAYEGRDGNLILGRVGNQEMASGFREGVNVQSARPIFSMAQRFSDVTVIMTSIDTAWQTNPNAQVVGLSASNTVYTAKDPTVPRYRPHLVITEQTDNLLGMAKQRADWEVARRYGRSQAVRIICDSWRASDGTLWAINALAPVDIPTVKLSNLKWLIAEVTFARDLQRGTTAELTLMPPKAFEPEPILLYPFDVQLSQDLQAGTSPGTPGTVGQG